MKIKPSFIDPNIKRKSEIIQNNLQLIPGTKVPLPSLIEISDSGTCNRKCSFCPRSDEDYIDKKEFISQNLHNKLLTELSSFNYKGMIIYSGFNEPLLNKDIYKNITKTREYLPDSKIELITNGDVLNNERLSKLFVSGLSTILISIYDGEDDYFKFKKMCEDIGLSSNQYILRKRYLSKEENFGITISNRGGLMKNAKFPIKSLDKPLNSSCFYPSYTFFLDYNGDVLMCSHDWGKKNILGNLNNEKFIDIWLSDKAKETRSRLFSSFRDFSPCNICDANGSLIGSNHVKAWKNL